jgi:hypothetical protein
MNVLKSFTANCIGALVPSDFLLEGFISRIIYLSWGHTQLLYKDHGLLYCVVLVYQIITK